MFNRLFFLILLFFLQACAKNSEGGYDLPLLYKVDIQQGNFIRQEMLDKLRIDMNKEQVRFILGTPAIIDPFRKDRWDYIFSEKKGGGPRTSQHITLYFQGDKLKRISGNISPAFFDSNVMMYAPGEHR